MRKLFILMQLAGCLVAFAAQAQRIPKMPKYLGDSFTIHHENMVLFSVVYNPEFYTDGFSLKNYYGNVILYNYKNDTQKYLFEKDTYIAPFGSSAYNGGQKQVTGAVPNNISKKYLFLLVKQLDWDKNQKIDGADPTALMVCNLDGTNLRTISPPYEHVLSFDLFEDDGFALIKMQRDMNGDRDFTEKDKDFYYLKVELENFKEVAKIDLNLIGQAKR